MKTYIYGIAHFSNGEIKASRNFVNYGAFSNWANAQFKKDKGVTVEEYHFRWGEWVSKKVSTWHA